jgi:antitoxin YefM
MTTSLANVKAHLSRYVKSVQDTHERVTITRNGEPAAVLMSPDDLASLEETIAVLSDPQLMSDIREAEAAVARGDVTPLAEVLDELRRNA